METTAIMEGVAIIENSYVRATYIKDLKLVIVAWDGQITSENYRSTYITVLEFQKNLDASKPAENFMADLRKQGVVNPADRKWFEEVAIPRAIAQGVKRTAVVTDANVFKKYYLNLILKATNKFGLPLKLFGTPEEAFAWFKNAS
jgi:hypothetical protein